MNIVETYKAFADESRLRIIHALSRGQFNVQELTSILNLGQSTVSHHLKVLQQASVATPTRQGTWAYYTLSGAAANGAAEIVDAFLKCADESSDVTLTPVLARDRSMIAEVENKRRDKGHRFFESVAKNWSAIRTASGSDEALLEHVASLIPKEGIVLDVGCGSGALLEKILPRSGNTIGVDFSQSMLNEAGRNLSRLGQDADLRLGYLEHLPLGDAAVDLIVGYMVFHHLPRPQEALNDAYRVIKPGGKLMICDLVAHQNEEMREHHGDLWLGFEPKEFKRWLAEAGFKDPEVEIVGHSGTVFLITCSK